MAMEQMDGPVEEAVEATGQMIKQGANQNAGEPFDSSEIRAGLRENVPPAMREAYDKVVAAGMKIMFDKSTHHLMQEQMAAEGETSEKLAEGVASLMAMLLQNTKGAFPEHLIIPAGIELMLHAADFSAQGAGRRIDANTMADAIQSFIFKLFEGSGVNPEQLIGSIGKIKELNDQAGSTPAPQDGEQPGAQPAPQQAAGGLLTQPMGA